MVCDVMKLRQADNRDTQQLIALIDGVYREYGDQICLDGADCDLLDIESYYLSNGGSFVVLEEDGGPGKGGRQEKGREKGSGTFCAKHPEGRSGKRSLTPFLEEDGVIVGSHATLPIDASRGIVTLRRLYLRKDLRGTEHSAAMMTWALDWARSRGYRTIEFWSDTRFQRAHRFFEKFGFTRHEIREMNDGSMPYKEYRFHMTLDPASENGRSL
jgi:putative acetyltransferase